MPSRTHLRSSISRSLTVLSIACVLALATTNGLPALADPEPESASSAPAPGGPQVGDPYPVEYDQLCNQAVGLIENSDWKAAYQMLNRAIDLVPYRPDAYYIYGRAHLLREEPAAAEQAFRKVLEIDPDLSAAWYELAKLMVLKEDLDAAIEYTEQAITLTDGRTWRYLALLGELKAEKGDRLGAEKAFDEAIAILSERCTAIANAIHHREQTEETVEIIVDTDYYVVYQQLIEVPNIRHETRHKVAPSEWVADLARQQSDLTEVTSRKAEVLAWMDTRAD